MKPFEAREARQVTTILVEAGLNVDDDCAAAVEAAIIVGGLQAGIDVARARLEELLQRIKERL